MIKIIKILHSSIICKWANLQNVSLSQKAHKPQNQMKHCTRKSADQTLQTEFPHASPYSANKLPNYQTLGTQTSQNPSTSQQSASQILCYVAKLP